MPINSKPIWKDIYQSFTNGSQSYHVYIQDSGDYNGVAHLRPNETEGRIRINDLVKNALKQEIPNVIGEPSLIDTLQKSYTFVGAEATGGVFRLDWSYDEMYNPEDKGGVLSAPIRNVLSPKQYLCFTHIGDTSLTLDFIGSGGTLIPYPDSDYNYFCLIPEGATEAQINIGQTGFIFKISEGCERYCIYYVNEYGGWDSLLVEGRGIKTDTYKRYSFHKGYDNRIMAERGVNNYLNDIVRSFELHTGWLTGGEGSRMHHLLGSNLVFLHDLVDGELFPVTITNNECRYKDYHNNGNQLVDYTINVDVARDYRRE